MIRQQRHRGPDDTGIHTDRHAALGHARLSIIDLGGGHQPMANEDGTVWVVSNGEIYNFKEIRARLEPLGHTFRTDSDTEVLVHGYEQWGTDLFSKLNGMFAIGLWDSTRQRAVLARDRMGQKPLYFAEHQGRLGFASQLKALREWKDLPLRLDLRSLSRYLLYEYVPSPWCILSPVRKLDRAEYLVWERGRSRRHRYWSPGGAPPHPVPARIEEAAEAFWDLLTQAVRLRLVSDVPLGAFLSGGIDSSAVVAAMSELLPAGRVKTFSVGFEDWSFDESAYAQTVADRFGTDHHRRLFQPRQMLELLPHLAEVLDEPLADPSVLPTHLLSRFAREQVTVSLSGDGGDELLAGYPTFPAASVARWLRLLPPPLGDLLRDAADYLPVDHHDFSLDFRIKRFFRGFDRGPNWAHPIWLGAVSPAEQQQLLTDDVRSALGSPRLDREYRRRFVPPGLGSLQTLIEQYCRTYLQEDILTKTDRASMACALEVRAPFLDPNVVEFLYHVPARWKLRGWRTKVLLKQAARNRLPDVVRQRRKKGFGIPVARWLCGELRGLMRDTLAAPRLRAQGLFRPEWVQRVIREHLDRKRDHRKALWTLITFQLWYDRYGRGLPVVASADA